MIYYTFIHLQDYCLHFVWMRPAVGAEFNETGEQLLTRTPVWMLCKSLKSTCQQFQSALRHVGRSLVRLLMSPCCGLLLVHKQKPHLSRGHVPLCCGFMRCSLWGCKGGSFCHSVHLGGGGYEGCFPVCCAFNEGPCLWGAEVLIWGADNAWKPSAWVLCLIVPWYPPVTFILHSLVQSQANFDIRKGCKGWWGGARGGFLKGKVEEKDRVCEVWNKIAFYPTVQH